jgi:glutamyl-tRNA synthetase
MDQRVTRIAPSPTGALHLGNARTFLINWAMARQAGWRVVLRMEDLDGPRVKPEAARQAVKVLRWLGLDWDEGPVFQSDDLQPYRDALTKLAKAGHTYPCPATRREIESALSAPHLDEHETRYPGLYRPPLNQPLPESEPTATRLIVLDELIRFTDAFVGPQSCNVQQHVGDFIIETKASLPSYQLAVVVDDARQGVNEIVRGDDLLSSTARQILLYRLLDLGPPPRTTHLPLVLGPDGHRLAKRHGDTKLIAYRDAGVQPGRVIALLAQWCGLGLRKESMSSREFLDAFDLSNVSRDPVVMQPEDDGWLKESI